MSHALSSACRVVTVGHDENDDAPLPGPKRLSEVEVEEEVVPVVEGAKYQWFDSEDMGFPRVASFWSSLCRERVRFDCETMERIEGGGDCDEASATGPLLLHVDVVLLEAFMVGRRT